MAKGPATCTERPCHQPHTKFTPCPMGSRVILLCSNFSYPDLGRREKEAQGCSPPSAEHSGASESSLPGPALAHYELLKVSTDVCLSFLLFGFRSKRAFPRRQGNRPSALLPWPLWVTHWKVEPDRSPLGLWSLFMSLDTFSLCMPSRLARRINWAPCILNEQRE